MLLKQTKMTAQNVLCVCVGGGGGKSEEKNTIWSSHKNIKKSY